MLLSTLGVSIPVEYRSCQDRCEFERSCYELWRKRGFAVPEIVPCSPEIDPKRYALCLEHIEGRSLDTVLRSAEIPMDEKLDLLKSVFTQNSSRYAVALVEKEHRLVHYDSNPRNVILSNQEPVHIDFEMGHLKEDIFRSVAREVKKLVLEATNILGRKNIPAVVDALIAAETDPRILTHIVEQVLHRSLARFHLAREGKRKQRSPERVTKQDLARAIIISFKKKCLRESYHSKFAYQNTTVAESYLEKRFSHTMGRRENEETRFALARALDWIPGTKKILDMPCGNGRLSSFFCEKGYIYLGADISLEMLEVLARDQRRQGKTTPLVRCDGEYLPFKDNAFDCVVCIRFLNHHIPDDVREKILREMRRVSRKWLIVQSQHLRFLGPFVLSKVLVRELLGRNVKKYRFHKEILNAGWSEERRLWIHHLNRYIGVYKKI